MILTKTIQIRWNGRTKKYYQNKGYKYTKLNDFFTCKIEDVQTHSHYKVLIKCDECGEVEEVKIGEIKDKNYVLCKKCRNILHRKHIEEKNLKKYGVKYPFCSKKIQEKAKNTIHNFSQNKKRMFIQKRKKTNLQRYGVDEVAKNENIFNKVKKTNLKKYGVEFPLQNQEIHEKQKNTMEEKYGVKYSAQSKRSMKIRNKTNLKKYGVEQVTQNIEIQKKMKKSMIKKNNVAVYTQQQHICDVLSAKLNVLINKFIVDMVKENYIIEYDGSGHTIHVKYQNLTKEEFYRKENERNQILINEGYNIIHMICRQDKLPNDSILLRIFNKIQMKFNDVKIIYVDLDNKRIILNDIRKVIPINDSYEGENLC